MAQPSGRATAAFGAGRLRRSAGCRGAASGSSRRAPFSVSLRGGVRHLDGVVTLTPARERATLLVLAAVQFTHVIDFMIMMPLGPQLMQAFHIGPAMFARVVASYGFSAGLCGGLATFVLDRFDRKRSLLVLYSGFALATLTCGLARELWVLFLARVLAGAFGGVAGSVVTATVGDVVPAPRRGAGMGVVMSAFSLAQIFGVPAGLWLAAHADWHAPFVVLAMVAVPVAVGGLFILPRVDAHLAENAGHAAWARVREIATHANHLRAFALIAALTMSGMIVVPFLATAVVRNGGTTETTVVLVYVCGGVATLFTNNLLGRLGDRFGHVRVFNLSAWFAIVPVLAVTSLGRWPVAVILVATTAFMVSMGGRWTPAMALVTMSVESRLRGGFMSLNSAIQALFGGIASVTSGLIVAELPDGRLQHYGWAGVVSLACLGLGVLLIRRVRIVDTAAVPRPPEPESGAMD